MTDRRPATLRLAPLRLAVVAFALLAAACERTGGLAPVTTVGETPASAGGAVSVAKGDTLYGLSRRYNVPLRDLIEANGLQPPYTLAVGQRIVLPSTRQYIVQKGDTLYGIARMFNVEVSEVTRLNNLPPPYAVQAGQPLRLPGSGGGTGAPTALAEAPAPAKRGSVTAEALPAPGGGTGSAAAAPAAAAAAQPAAPAAAAPAAASSASGDVAYEPGQEPKALRPPVPPVRPAAPPPAAAKDAAPAQTAPSQTAAAAAPKAAEPPARGAPRFLWPLKGRILSGFGPKPDGMHNDGLNIAAAKGTPVRAADNGVVAYAGNELKGFGNLLLLRHADGWITAYAHLDELKVDKGATVKRGQVIGTVGQSGAVDAPQLHFELRRGSQAVDPREHLEGTTAAAEGQKKAG